MSMIVEKFPRELSCGPLLLRLLEDSHREPMWRAFEDSFDDLKKYMFWAEETRCTRNMDDFFQRMSRAAVEGTDCVYVVTLPGDDRHLGSVGLHHMAPHTRAAELGYWVWSKASGRGLATAVGARLLRLAFEELRLHRVFARHAVTNIASQKVIEHLGFVHEGTLRHYLQLEGRWVDHHTYGLLEDEYRQRRDVLLTLEENVRLENFPV